MYLPSISATTRQDVRHCGGGGVSARHSAGTYTYIRTPLFGVVPSPKFFIILLLLSFYLFPFSTSPRIALTDANTGTGSRHLYAYSATGIPSPQYIIYVVIIKPIPVQLASYSATRRQSYTYARLQRTTLVTVSLNHVTTVMVIVASLSHRSP